MAAVARGGRASRIVSFSLASLAMVSFVASCSPPPELVPFPTVEESVVQPAAPDTVGPLRMSGANLVDATGRVVLIHGMNSVRKEAPFYPNGDSGWLSDLDLEYLRNGGFNGIRLGISAAALMPDPGVVDQDYLDRVVEVIDKLSAEGMWVQLDMHQDVFHLMPDWATPPDAVDLSEEIPPLVSFVGWAGQYMSDKSVRQWNSFLEGEPIIDGRSVASVLGDAAAALASAAADRPNVIGLELLNEPVAGDSIIRCIAEGCADRDRLLSDRYAEMIAPIRVAAPEMAIWIEPFAPTAYASGPEMPMPEATPTSNGAQIGLAWHLYCKDTDGGKPVQSDALIASMCANRMDNGMAAALNQAERLGAGTGPAVPRMLNEFGASNDPLDVTLVGPRVDAGFVSWMYYHAPHATSPFDSSMPDVVESQIIRAYPQATAGTPGQLRYDPASGEFSYSYTADLTITAPTSIVIPSRAYPNGYTASVTGGTITSAPQAGRLTVEPDADGGTVTVKVSRG